MKFTGITYRPLVEAMMGTELLQATEGCARNACTFCTMYADKFKVEHLSQIEQDIRELRMLNPHIERIFLVNGDAYMLGVAGSGKGIDNADDTARIMLDGASATFTTGVKCTSEEWSVEKHRINPRSKGVSERNAILSNIENRLFEIFYTHRASGENVSAKIITEYKQRCLLLL